MPVSFQSQGCAPSRGWEPLCLRRRGSPPPRPAPLWESVGLKTGRNPRWRRERPHRTAPHVHVRARIVGKYQSYPLSVLAREHGVPFYVAAPFSTVDFSLSSGQQIPIEERDAAEVTHVSGVRV